MPTTPNMGLVLPTEGGSSDLWGLILNAVTCFGRVDLHDHSSGLGVKVKPNGLDWNADLSATSGGVPFALKDVKAVDFTPVAASTITTYAGAFFVNSDDANNLYFRTVAGSNVKVTNGAALNLSATGGIVGDYASVSAEVAYDDANDRYTFKQESSGGVRQWAKMSHADVDIYEYKAAGDVTNIVNRVRLSSPAALAASYALTFPAALPGSTQLLQVSSAGAITASNTIVNDLTMTADKHVVVSGTGQFKHGDRTIALLPDTGNQPSAGGTIGTNGEITGASTLNIQIPLPAGKRIKSAVITYNRGGAGTVTLQIERRTGDGAGANFATVGSSFTTSAGTGWTTGSTGAINHTMATGWVYMANVVLNNAANAWGLVEITYDEP